MKLLPLAALFLAASAVALVPAPAEAGKCKRSYHRHWAKAKDLTPGPWCAGGCRSFAYVRFCREVCQGDRDWNPAWLK